LKKILFYCLFSVFIHGQNIEGEVSEIKELIMNANEVTTIVFNYGSIQAPNRLGQVADFYWKGLGYLFEFGPVFGGEVVNGDGDTLHIFSDSFIRSMQGDYSPTGEKWGFLPQSGYVNPTQNEIANSLNPDSWPAGWTTWPGEFGEGYIAGLNEAYYIMDDFTNAEFEYYPFEADSSLRGLGMEAEVRLYQLDGRYKNSLLLSYKVTNVSDKPVYKTYFGFHGDPHIGGTSDYADDRVYYANDEIMQQYPDYPDARNTIYFWDQDGMGIGGLPTGVIGFKLLATPDNLGLTSLHPAQYTNSLPNVPLNDPLMWEWFSGGIDENSPFFTNAGDNIISFGTGPFLFNPGETKEFSLIIFLADDLEQLLADADLFTRTYTRIGAGTDFGSYGGNESYKIELSELASNTISGDVEIKWNYTGADNNALVDIDYFSTNEGAFIPLATGVPVTSSYIWHTLDFPDGMNYSLRVTAYNQGNYKEFYYDVVDERIIIDNPEVNAKPEIKLENFAGGMFYEAPITINYYIEDADNDNLDVTLEFTNNNSANFNQIYSEQHSHGSYSFEWNPVGFANSPTCYIRLSVSDGENNSRLYSKSFALNIYQGIYEQNHFDHPSGIGTPEIRVEVIDDVELTGDEYEITFNADDETNVLFSVKNLSTSEMMIENFPVNTGATTVPFEGIALKIKDVETGLDIVSSGFTNSELDTCFEARIATLGNHVADREDWYIVFNGFDTLANGNYLFPGDTVLNTTNEKTICPFNIYAKSDGLQATYRIIETILGNKKNGKYDLGEIILLQPQGETGFNTVYDVVLFERDVMPAAGDTLWIKSYKSVNSEDVFRFFTNSEYIVGIDDGIELNNYSLSNNYPNPFNPSTQIRFSLAEDSKAVVKVFDILGREIVELVNENLKAGEHSVRFKATANLASGVYVYTLQAGNYFMARKMMLIK